MYVCIYLQFVKNFWFTDGVTLQFPFFSYKQIHKRIVLLLHHETMEKQIIEKKIMQAT